MEENLNFSKMEDNLNFSIMEDDHDYFKNEDDLNVFKNGRMLKNEKISLRPFNIKWTVTRNTFSFILHYSLFLTPSILYSASFNFQSYSRGWSLTQKKTFLLELHTEIMFWQTYIEGAAMGWPKSQGLIASNRCIQITA